MRRLSGQKVTAAEVEAPGGLCSGDYLQLMASCFVNTNGTYMASFSTESRRQACSGRKDHRDK